MNKRTTRPSAPEPALPVSSANGEGGQLETLLRIPQVEQILGLGRKKIYQLIYYEGLPTIRFGRALRVDPTALHQWIKQRQEQSA
jgi:excisionase family DNA binding protein